MWNAFLLVIALSLDSFLASLAYGGEHIRIPWKSAILISSIGVLFLSLSLYTAAFIQQFIPPYICRLISFLIFFMIGISSLFQGTIKSFLGTYKRKKLSFEYSGISFVLDIYLDETKADADHSKLLSLKEALYLAIALSIDSLASGFALGISIVQPLPVLIISFCIGILAILCGSFLGSRMLSLKECRLSWLSGVLFLILAFSRIL
ncbi:manganese efflux pump [[Clostridium] innocuum]|nr:manganese efflux pump [[Clostridium] innocuum]